MSSATKDNFLKKIDIKNPNSKKDWGSLSVLNRTRQKAPKINIKKIKEFVLGKNYDLSLAFVGDATSKMLNSTLRKKNRPTNILSFPLSKNDGEIFIDLSLVKKEAKITEQNYTKYFAYILIHGLAHLKGFEHGSRMEEEESRVMKRFLGGL